MKKTVILFSFLLLCTLSFSQEKLKSFEAEYYDFLSLTNSVKKNYINYRTLEENTFSPSQEDEKHVWASLNLGKNRFLFNNSNISYKIYGLEWFSSYNTAAPFGYYDGALWQGRGYNTAISGGLRFDCYGFSLSILPQISFSQNLSFEIMKARNGISEFGYFWSCFDAPQRFGDKAFWNFDWGDTEIRYTWRKFTVGFGTEAIWLGPTTINPVLASNNAPTYPKFDLGLRPTKIVIPFVNWYIGDIETRLWVGKLQESDYYDSDETNDYNQYSGFTLSYAPSFVKGLSLGFAKVTLNKWGENFWRYALPFFKGNTINTSENDSGEDQKAALFAHWLFSEVGLEIYGELGFDDFLSAGLALYEYARYPFHAMTYAVGLKKTFELSKEKKIRGVLSFEWNDTEGSQDYQMWTGYNFGAHHQVTQGYTNEGQWLGSGIGYGGNSQALSFTVYSPHGYEKFIIGRNNIDNNYIFYKCVGADEEETKELGKRYYTAFKANFYVGFENLYVLFKNFSIKYSFIYDLIINPTYEPKELASWGGANRGYSYWTNFHFSLALKYQL